MYTGLEWKTVSLFNLLVARIRNSLFLYGIETCNLIESGMEWKPVTQFVQLWVAGRLERLSGDAKNKSILV